MRARAAILVTLTTFLMPLAAQAQQIVASAAAADSQDVTQTAPEPAVMTPPPNPVVQTEPDFPRGRISGYMFGDAYYNVTGDPVHVYSGSADLGKVNIDGTPNIGKDLNGFQLRRVYFQLDNDLSVKFATRFRLEMDGKELTSGGKLGVFVKNAYLQAKNVVPRGNFFFGEITTPTFESSEEFWQYRAIEKTIADFRGIASSSDLGVELKGYADGAHKIGYSAMLGNGQGQKPETNRYKRYYFSLPLNPIHDFKIEPYVDYEPGVAGADKALYKLFAGYEFKKAALGGEVVDQVAHSRIAPNTEARGFSVFARATPMPTLAAFVRADRWQPNKRNDNRVDQDLLIGGVDWQAYKDVHIMPNVESMQYRAKGTAVAPAHHDTQARITFYYKFSKP
ncbi:MAG TPA: hypothetical protein VEU09_10085 [Candidatus Binatia bacterium]|nr:hypothetical protein [Candidatus Binatia bacterium]